MYKLQFSLLINKLHKILGRYQRFWYFVLLSALVFSIIIITPFLTVQATTNKNCTDRTCAIASDQGLQLSTQAKSLYQAGKFREAIDIWQKAINAFASANDITNQAMALSNLSLTYQQLGEWQAATEAINKSLTLLNNTSIAILSAK